MPASVSGYQIRLPQRSYSAPVRAAAPLIAGHPVSAWVEVTQFVWVSNSNFLCAFPLLIFNLRFMNGIKLPPVSRSVRKLVGIQNRFQLLFLPDVHTIGRKAGRQLDGGRLFSERRSRHLPGTVSFSDFLREKTRHKIFPTIRLQNSANQLHRQILPLHGTGKQDHATRN